MGHVVNDLVFLWATGLLAGLGLMLLIIAIRTRREAWVYCVAVFVILQGCLTGWSTFSDLKRSYDKQIQINIDLHKAK